MYELLTEHEAWRADARALAALVEGPRVLDLGVGPGAGVVEAARVDPGRRPVGLDLSGQMLRRARARARAEGVPLDAVRADALALPLRDGAFDGATAHSFLYLLPDPARAVREIARVLRPGGRVTLAVWGPREQNPWLGVVFDAVTAQLGAPTPPPGLPGPFSLSDDGRLAALLVDAGLADVAVSAQPVPYRAASAQEWWSRTAALAGPLAQRLAALPEPAQAALFARASDAIRVYETPDGLDIPGVSLIATARRR